PGETLNLSPRELKERVLEVLEFNEAPDPKAQSLIFRYAVYTPQEAMKEVLSMTPDIRLQTLLRAFRVEDYKTAAENAAEVGREIRGDVRELDGLGRGAEKLRAELEEIAKDEERQGTAVESLRASEAESESALDALKARREKLQADRVGLEKSRTEARMLEGVLRAGEGEVSDFEEEIADLEERISTLDEELEGPKAKRAPGRRTVAQLKAEERKAESEVKRLTAVKATIKAKLEDYGTIMEKGICPVCDRPVEAHDFGRRMAAKDEERKHASVELERAEGELDRLRHDREAAEEFAVAKQQAVEKGKERDRMSKSLTRGKKGKEAAKRKMQEASTRLKELGTEIGRLEEVSAGLAQTDKGIRQAEETLRKTRDRIAGVVERMSHSADLKVKLREEIAAKERAATKRAALAEDEVWLNGYFVPTVELIERSVLATINQDFGALFQKWFSMLVDDPDKEVRIADDFSPTVTQGGYEQDVGYLSGGERTSVALAYRLALNSMAQRVSAGMRSDLLILDEPTDGFSREQLGNVREVLDDLGCPQVIIVSHDKELESFADQIFRVRKSGGESTIEAPGAR
ncbi:MAG: SMC family ATPase, partial [Thaumarchaeota archaeon]|nr:SMC family ATPase [Nitrososphaerota archaeon]